MAKEFVKGVTVGEATAEENTQPAVSTVETNEEETKQVIRANEEDFIAGLIAAADFASDEEETQRIEIVRNGKLAFAFSIRPLGSEEYDKCLPRWLRWQQALNCLRLKVSCVMHLPDGYCTIVKSFFQIFFDLNFTICLRQDLFDQVRPLDHGHTLSVKTILVTDLIHFFNITDAVYIKMIKWQSAFLVYLHNGKCWAADWLGDSKSIRESLGKYCFSNSQITD